MWQYVIILYHQEVHCLLIGVWWCYCWTWHTQRRLVQGQHVNNAVVTWQLDCKFSTSVDVRESGREPLVAYIVFYIFINEYSCFMTFLSRFMLFLNPNLSHLSAYILYEWTLVLKIYWFGACFVALALDFRHKRRRWSSRSQLRVRVLFGFMLRKERTHLN